MKLRSSCRAFKLEYYKAFAMDPRDQKRIILEIQEAEIADEAEL
jgi:hypothetical protein